MQDAINTYTNGEVDIESVEYTKPHETPNLEKAQDKINDIWHKIYQQVFNQVIITVTYLPEWQ